jgi:hypothetical protein
MKKQTILNFVKGALYMLLFAVCALQVVYLVSPEAAEALLAFVGTEGSGAFVLANTTMIASNTRATTDAARPRSADDPGHIDEDVSDFVTMIMPDDFALDTLLRESGQSEKATDLIVNFEEVEFRGHEDQTGAVFTASGGSASTDKFIDLEVANPSLWLRSETIYIPSIIVGGEPLQLRVDSINSDGTLKVTAINTTDNVVPTIASGTSIYRGANAVGELKARGENKSLIPGNRWNYCQRYTAEVSEGYIRGMLDTKSGYSFKDQNFIRMYDFRTNLAKSGYFGTKRKAFSQDEQEEVLYAEGIFHQLNKELDWTTAGGITNNLWIDWCNELFADNSGSSERFLFGGRNLIAAISKIPDVQKQLDGRETEIVAGVKLQRVETMFGDLYIKHDKVFNVMGHADDGIILDMEQIRKRPFLPLTSRQLKLREAGISNENATFIEEIMCLETRYLDAHARIIKSA